MLFLCLLFAISMENKFSANSENTQKKKEILIKPFTCRQWKNRVRYLDTGAYAG